MLDIYVGLLIVFLFAAALFLAGLRLSQAVGRGIHTLLLLATVAALFAYIGLVWQNIWLVNVLPFSNLIIVGNWFALGAGWLGGLAWHRAPGSWLRKGILVGGLICIGAYATIHPLLGEVPHCQDRWLYPREKRRRGQPSAL